MNTKIASLTVAALVVVVSSVLWAGGMFAMPGAEPAFGRIPAPDQADQQGPQGPQLVTFANGCFWCTEAVFQQLKGVSGVTSGYSGGDVKNPTYEQVRTKKTGHAECIQLTYDPKVISYVDLLEIFWQTHDPTTLNRQGNDIGPQYRSAIFYRGPEQKELAEKYKKKLDESGVFDKPIVTEITAFSEFYTAEKYHQNFFINNPDHRYCTAIIGPKLEKFRKVFKEKLVEGKGK